MDELLLRRLAIVRLNGIGGCGDLNPQIASSRKRPFTEDEIRQEMEELRPLLTERLAKATKE